MDRNQMNNSDGKVAIIGMSGAFPDASSIHALWDMLLEKREGLSLVDREESLRAGEGRDTLDNPDYVPRGGFLETAETFDEGFFGISPAEALATDPQHRLFLEHCWLALTDAGLAPGAIEKPVGVFAGEGITQYWPLLKDGPFTRTFENTKYIVGNEKDFLATRVSYKLNLKGPSVDIQSACSTSLVTVAMAYQSLLTWGCDLALAGGVMVSAPRRTGYVHRDGMILSRKGSCHPFDESADGTVFGEGVGVVCLKRLGEALEDGDYIYAVIDAVAVNNDGNDKIGFTAPSVNGQAEVIEMAQVMADVSPDAIGYVETHGTGTRLGDPIEISALKRVFGDRARSASPCYLGSLKANIGHLDVASGIASLIKAALIVNTGIIPPQMNFDVPNPELGLERSPFAVNKETVRWDAEGSARIAGVSSFGFGGTNAHAIIEGPPAAAARRAEPRPRPLLLTARSPSSLDRRRKSIVEYIRGHPELDPLEVAAKASRQRGAFACRWGVCAEDGAALVREMEAATEQWSAAPSPSCAFLFPGQGSQFPAMAKAYYGAFPVFTEWIDAGVAEMDRLGRAGFAELLVGLSPRGSIDETETTQPLLYITEFALAQELVSRGIVPSALAGHSIGEYAAAAVAGVFSFEEGLRLVCRRAYWMQRAPRGAMTAAFLPLERATTYARGGISVSVVNTSSQTILSGPLAEVEALEARLSAEGVRHIRLKTSHAFHSSMMDGILGGFEEDARGVDFREPRLPFLENVEGTWRRDGGDWAGYWTSQLRQPVRFDLCMRTLADLADPLLFEVGPGRALSGFARAFEGRSMHAIPLLPGDTSDRRHFEGCMIEAWGRGAAVRFESFDEAPSTLILLPGYQFDRTRFWPEPRIPAPGQATEAARDGRPRNDRAPPQPARDLVLAAWKKTLGAAARDVDADFFESGGDSLMAIMLAQAVKAECGVEICLPKFLQNPTPATLIRAIEEAAPARAAEAGASAVPGIPRRADRHSSPLSPQQERLWFLHALDKEKPLYNLVHVVRIEGETDIPRLTATLRRFFSRHDLFRARIVDVGDGARMEFAEEAEVPVRIADFGGKPAEEAERGLADLLRTEARRPIDLSSRPVCRCIIASLSGKSRAVCLFVPHIFTDGWSSEVFLNELRDLYMASGDALPPAAGADYGDYAAYEKETRAGWEPSDADAGFWRKYLEGIPENHGIPLDFPRPDEMSGLGSTLVFELGPELSARVRAACEAGSVTPSMFFLACLALLVRRCSTQETVVIGTPYANRERNELRSLFGYFIRTIPLRFDVDEGMRSGAWLRYVKERFLSAWEHSSLGIDELVDILSVPRRTNVNPIYQILFAFQSYLGKRESAEAGESPSFTQAFPDRGISENDLALYMWEREGFEGAIEYSTDLFERGTIGLLAANFKAVVEAVIAGPDDSLLALPLAGEEAMAALRRSNETAIPEFLGRTFLDLFRKACASRPEAEAVRFRGRSWSYVELDRDSDRMAERLIEAGAEPEEFIGVLLNRGYQLLCSLIGVMKAGCAYLPLDPGFPVERLRTIVQDAGARLVVTEHALDSAQLFEQSTLGRLLADEDVGVSGAEGHRLPKEIPPSATAYMLFTSGSTGRPKGVPISHGALANFLLSMEERPGIAESDRVLAITTVSFDISGLEFFLALCRGACVVVADEESGLDPTALSRLIEEERISFLQSTPSRMTLLLESGWKGRPGMKLLVGGEAVSRDLARRMLATGSEVWNMYGPTETTIWSSVHRIDTADQDPPIGQPIANTRFYILDSMNRPLPPGMPGELGIAGAGLSEGYHGLPDLTGERFIKIVGEEMVYRTGDLALADSSGVYRYLGRKDFQVKIRGYRIELGEIEQTIMKHPGILETACLVWAKAEDDKRIVAYYRSEVPIDLIGLQGGVRRVLPDYMMPNHYVRLASFPRTPSGKIDRKAFPASIDDSPYAAIKECEPPRDSVQSVMLEVWKEVLGRDGFGIKDNFFDLGGHSLLAMKLIRHLGESFGPRWSLRDLFENPTIESLASKVHEGKERPDILAETMTQPSGSFDKVIVEEPIIIPLRRGDPVRTPLICLLGIHLYADIAAAINEGTPVYGIHIPIMYDSSRARRPSLNQIALYYIDAVKKIQPEGPYQLAGFCFGGIVAFEAARLLELRGEQVSLVVILDAVLPQGRDINYPLRIAQSLKNPFKTMQKAVEKAKRATSPKPKHAGTASASKGKQERIVDLLNLPFNTLDVRRDIAKLMATNPRLDARLLAFRAARTPLPSWKVIHPDMGWASAAKTVKFTSIESDHINIVRPPYAKEVAETIDRELT
jgi:amino acid adenylation domain-containing protein